MSDIQLSIHLESDSSEFRTVGRFVKVDMNGGNVMQLTHGGGRIRRELDPPEGRRRNRDRNEGEILNI